MDFIEAVSATAWICHEMGVQDWTTWGVRAGCLLGQNSTAASEEAVYAELQAGARGHAMSAAQSVCCLLTSAQLPIAQLDTLLPAVLLCLTRHAPAAAAAPPAHGPKQVPCSAHQDPCRPTMLFLGQLHHV